MKNKINKILEKQISEIMLSDAESRILSEKAEEILLEIKRALKKKRIDADVFLGGSLAKETLIKKEVHDVDIFVRFAKKYKDEQISAMLARVVNGKKVHGSRDYFQIQKKNILFEIIPVARVSKPKEARNVTDLSYFHVSYIKKQTSRNKNLARQIMLAKSFCHGQNAYGAESYISGFSGYALELLVSHYTTFLGFVKAVAKAQKLPIVIDSAKFYDKKNVLWQVNESKLKSPIILIDPTFKERNALAALSNETFEKFKLACMQFLNHPSLSFFEKKKINEKEFNLVLEYNTEKQAGDIAGSKLKKFHNFFSKLLERNYEIKKQDFEYLEKQAGLGYFSIKQKKEVIISGPPEDKIENAMAFRKRHKDIFVKNKMLFAREKPKSIQEILNENSEKMKEMGIDWAGVL